MKLLAPAKINLFLEVKNKRKDGYHNLESLMQAVSLYDKLTIKPKRHGITFRCSDKNLPADEKNLAYKAAITLKNKLNVNKGADIYLEKNIPAGAGLGGGSSDAAAVIKGLLHLWKRKLSKSMVLALAKKLGADVPFFIMGGTAVARGIGEKLKKLKSLKDTGFLLVNPGFGISTKEVYNSLRFPLTRKQKINRITKQLNASAPSKKWGGMMFNRLEEAVLPKHPEIGRIKAIFTSYGYYSLMSGSGSTVFGVIESKKHAGKLERQFKKYGWKCWFVKAIE
jgi:4-diphosphocytidyl-2-C-methyl-D-erythritol kinase